MTVAIEISMVFFAPPTLKQFRNNALATTVSKPIPIY
jgi:hypothetical protein